MSAKALLVIVGLFCLRITTGQTPDAISLKHKLAAAREDTAKVNTLTNLAYTYVFSYPDSAGNYAKQGLQLARKIGYKSGEGGCFGVLGLASNFSGDYTNALQFGLQSLSIYTDLRDTTMMIWSGIQVAGDYNSLEDYEQALKHGHETKYLIDVRPKFSKIDSNQASVAFMSLATAYQKKNRSDSALYYAKMAFTRDSSWYGGYQKVGEAYAAIGRYDLALYYYKKGVDVAKKQGSLVFLASFYNDISKVFESRGRIDSAIFYANRSVQQVGPQTITLDFLQACIQLANLYQLQRRADSTIKYLMLANTLKDSLYSRKKTREAQNFAFNEVLRQQELVAQKQREQNKIRVAILLAAVALFLLIVFFLWRNNRRKQKANALLENKNKEIETALKQLKSTQAQLIHSEKMASLGELTAGIAHEIQNPLNFVNNFSEVNKELISEMNAEIDKGNFDEAKSIAKSIEENEQKINSHGKRADGIVKGMLMHSRTSAGQKELTDINALADEYLRLAYYGLRAKDKSFSAKFQTDFDNTIGKINIVPQDFGRVLLNLINNAFYAVSEKKQQLDAAYEPTVSVSTKKLKDSVEIKVKDNGNGIPQKVIDKIFQPFFTTKPTGIGTGLGLSLSYDIIKAHGGEIRVESHEREGAEFILQLPS